MSLIPKSLAMRVVGLSTLWAVAALFFIATIISTLYDRASVRNFESLLAANIFNLIGAVGLGADGSLDGAPDFGDIRYSQPASGWYWSVEPLDKAIAGSMSSPSLTKPIPSPDPAIIPFDANYQRSYVADGIDGEKVRVFESEFNLGTSQSAARFRLMGNETEFQLDLSAFRQRLWAYLGLFGLGMIAINAVAIRLGLRPLGRVRKSLERIRTGEVQTLEGEFPYEIEPLAKEMNALIDNNRRIVERSRTQVGNLAHSLKTPLAVLMNEGRALGGNKGKLIGEQTEAMRNQVEHYLQRARIAAQRDSVIFRTDAGQVMDRMIRVLEKLNPDKQLTYAKQDAKLVFAGERQDLEEIAGNLLENAMKWSERQVSVALGNDANGFVTIVIEDDGPGIPDHQAKEAIKRGKRLDENKPGTGLGLSIVAELVNEYGGDFELGKSGLGGLRVSVKLPVATG